MSDRSLNEAVAEAGNGAGLEPDSPAVRRIFVMLLLVQSVTVFDLCASVVALPELQRDLGATSGELQLILAAFSISVAVALVPSGRLGDLLGRRKLLLGGLVAFFLAAALSTVAPGPVPLIACRVLAGLSTAAIGPQLLATVQVQVPVARRPAAFGVWGIAGALGSILGQSGGGLLIRLDLAGQSWRPVFAVSALLGLFVLLQAWRTWPESRGESRRSFDLVGIVLLAGALSTLIYPLVMGRSAGWPPWTFASLAVAAVLFGAFGTYEWRYLDTGRPPLLDLRLFKLPSFGIGSLAVFAAFAAASPLMFLFTMLAQVGLGFDAFFAGLLMSFTPCGFFIGSRIGTRHPQPRTLVIGAFVGLAGIIYLGGGSLILGDRVGSIFLLLGMGLVGLGQGMVIPQLLGYTLSDVPGADAGSASAAMSTMQQAASAIGVAAAGVVYFAVLGDLGTRSAHVRAYSLATLLFLLSLHVVGIFLLFRLHIRNRGALDPALATPVELAPVLA